MIFLAWNVISWRLSGYNVASFWFLDMFWPSCLVKRVAREVCALPEMIPLDVSSLWPCQVRLEMILGGSLQDPEVIQNLHMLNTWNSKQTFLTGFLLRLRMAGTLKLES